MEASITLRPLYAIGIIFDDLLRISDLNKIDGLLNFIRDNLNENNRDFNDYTLKNTTETIRINIYIGVANNLPQRLKDKILEFTSGDTAYTNIRFMWFGNENINRQIMENRLRQWIREDNPAKVWIVDPNTNTSGDVLSKFI